MQELSSTVTHNNEVNNWITALVFSEVYMKRPVLTGCTEQKHELINIITEYLI